MIRASLLGWSCWFAVAVAVAGAHADAVDAPRSPVLTDGPRLSAAKRPTSVVAPPRRADLACATPSVPGTRRGLAGRPMPSTPRGAPPRRPARGRAARQPERTLRREDRRPAVSRSRPTLRAQSDDPPRAAI